MFGGGDKGGLNERKEEMVRSKEGSPSARISKEHFYLYICYNMYRGALACICAKMMHARF